MDEREKKLAWNGIILYWVDTWMQWMKFLESGKRKENNTEKCKKEAGQSLKRQKKEEQKKKAKLFKEAEKKISNGEKPHIAQKSQKISYEKPNSIAINAKKPKTRVE
jgi:hypothetical protein